jgi:ketosteroid isomerase-like protein
MSRENVEIVQRAFEEFTRGGWEPLMGTYWAPEIVWDMSLSGIPGLGTYRGFDELRTFFEDWFSTFPFEEWEQEVDEVIDCGGEQVVVLTRQHARSVSGVAAEMAYAQVIELRERKIVRTTVYLDRERALEAAGLSE